MIFLARPRPDRYLALLKAIEAYFHAGNVKEGSSEAALLTENCMYVMQVHAVSRHTEDITLVILTTTLSIDLRSDIIVSKIEKSWNRQLHIHNN